MSSRPYLAFVPQHAASSHSVLAVVERGDGPEAETLIALSDAPSAAMLASALNGVLLHQVTAERRLEAVLDGAPDTVRKAISSRPPVISRGFLREEVPVRVRERRRPPVG